MFQPRSIGVAIISVQEGYRHSQFEEALGQQLLLTKILVQNEESDLEMAIEKQVSSYAKLASQELGCLILVFIGKVSSTGTITTGQGGSLHVDDLAKALASDRLSGINKLLLIDHVTW